MPPTRKPPKPARGGEQGSTSPLSQSVPVRKAQGGSEDADPGSVSLPASGVTPLTKRGGGARGGSGRVAPDPQQKSGLRVDTGRPELANGAGRKDMVVTDFDEEELQSAAPVDSPNGDLGSPNDDASAKKKEKKKSKGSAGRKERVVVPTLQGLNKLLCLTGIRVPGASCSNPTTPSRFLRRAVEIACVLPPLLEAVVWIADGGKGPLSESQKWWALVRLVALPSLAVTHARLASFAESDGLVPLLSRRLEELDPKGHAIATSRCRAALTIAVLTTIVAGALAVVGGSFDAAQKAARGLSSANGTQLLRVIAASLGSLVALVVTPSLLATIYGSATLVSFSLSATLSTLGVEVEELLGSPDASSVADSAARESGQRNRRDAMLALEALEEKTYKHLLVAQKAFGGVLQAAISLCIFVTLGLLFTASGGGGSGAGTLASGLKSIGIKEEAFAKRIGIAVVAVVAATVAIIAVKLVATMTRIETAYNGLVNAADRPVAMEASENLLGDARALAQHARAAQRRCTWVACGLSVTEARSGAFAFALLIVWCGAGALLAGS